MTQSVHVIGKSGQLARALNRCASDLGLDLTCHGRDQIDLTSPINEITDYIDALPDKTNAVITAAAYTDVDGAETDRETAFSVNAIAPRIIAAACERRGFAMVHISTDYVFDGTANAPYKTTHPTNPINIYGASKREGELGVIQSLPRSAILRTSWVFDESGKNFLTTMLKLGKTRDNLNVVGDQRGRPTYAGDLAEAVLMVSNFLTRHDTPFPIEKRVFHVSNSGPIISWADFAEHIFAVAENFSDKNIAITAIPSSQYPTPARRPSYSALDISRFEKQFAHSMPNWKSGLKSALLANQKK